MAGKPVDREGFSLRRWSQRKLDAARPREADNAAPRSSDALTAVAPPPVADAAGTDPTAAPLAPASEMPPAAAPVVAAPTELPSLDSLTIDSDYSPFMQPGVDDALKRGALKQLFKDPRFNVMDGLDVYIDDYSKPDPIDPAVVRQLVSARYIFDPPATRVNALGHVEDVPDEQPAEVSRQEPRPEVGSEHGAERETALQDGPQREATSQDGPPREAALQDGPQREGASQDAPQREAALQDGPQRDAGRQVTPAQSAPQVATVSAAARAAERPPVAANAASSPAAAVDVADAEDSPSNPS